MKNLLALLTMVAMFGILSGCRETAPEPEYLPAEIITHGEVNFATQKETVESKIPQNIYSGITIGQNTMNPAWREKADMIAAEVSAQKSEE
ncbi:MAG: hypothetical protein PHO45_01035 [Victivallaceae bacterium]|jgi:hypothetical protein|nr:hypothetical protein [Victivallaceae bacterium]